MAKKRRRHGRRQGSLQIITLCISTSLVLILLGMVTFTVLTARNLSSYVKENLTVTLMLSEKMTVAESQRLRTSLNNKRYISRTLYISPQQALKEHVKAMGSDPTDFLGGNPFVGSIEMQLKAEYANNDSLKWITRELRANSNIEDITYQKDFMDQVNANLRKISIVLLVLAALLTFISFSLINNTIRLSVFSRRFSIHTMKLVGASWSFIRWPFIKRAIAEGLVAAIVADGVLAAGIYALYNLEPEILVVVDWRVMTITGVAVLLFGLIITTFCSYLSVNRFLRMSAGDLYKI
ncbi:MAG: permease-like cell division protein FtsX [bacterium]|nr:cell division protein FtsX [Hoylesella loescheii]MCI6477193.1 permease-like cell division protein FtsX [Bacteroidales bacterium]MDO4209958.1 permease-like cell division protein FtsX [bacterium]MDY3356522.1 permease-like cell division protein FtsX [Prevotella sp.]MCI6723590.1 permease-like cell division protein FtsX [Bacteroidales bacterium]